MTLHIFLIYCYFNGYLLILVCIIYFRHCFTFSKLQWSTFRIRYVVCERNKFIWVMHSRGINLGSDLQDYCSWNKQQTKCGYLPICVGVINYQENLGFLVGYRDRTRWLIYESCSCLCGLLHGTGDRVEDAGTRRKSSWMLNWLLPPLCCWGNRVAGGIIWTLKVHHVTIWQVSHKTTVWETPPKEIHSENFPQVRLKNAEAGFKESVWIFTGWLIFYHLQCWRDSLPPSIFLFFVLTCEM